jgi:hypothetical protein
MGCRGENLMELPRALLPWRQSLSIFPPDLAIALGGVIDKLALLIGPLVSPDGSGRNEPDGFDGIGRRGSFERLLTTEWALAEEAPLEFLRRVSTGELSFLEIAHKKHTVARKCVALFDVGPDQRGGPRIAHLAALILLAQRAHDGGATFYWGVLQDSATELMTDVNEESVRALLKASIPRHVEVDDIIKFFESFQADKPEVWLVGGPRTSEILADANMLRVQIEDSFDPDAPSDLQITLSGEKSKPRWVRLELPPGNTAVRLLRDPFQVARATPQRSRVRIAKDTNIVFTRDYRKLFLRGAEGELITIPVPNSPNAKQSFKPRIFHPPDGEMLVGVGRLMGVRTIVAITLRDRTVYMHQLSSRLCTSINSKEYTLARDSDALLPLDSSTWFGRTGNAKKLGNLFQLESNAPFFLYDGERILFKFDGTSMEPFETSVTAAHQENSILYWVGSVRTPTWVQYNGAKRHELPLNLGTHDVRCAPGGFVATQESATTWRVLNASGELQSKMDVPSDNQVVGFITGTKGGFVVMDVSRTRISFLAKDALETWITAPAPIKTVHAIPGCWLIAFITEEDELCIYSFDHKTLLLRMRLGDV